MEIWFMTSAICTTLLQKTRISGDCVLYTVRIIPAGSQMIRLFFFGNGNTIKIVRQDRLNVHGSRFQKIHDFPALSGMKEKI